MQYNSKNVNILPKSLTPSSMMRSGTSCEFTLRTLRTTFELSNFHCTIHLFSVYVSWQMHSKESNQADLHFRNLQDNYSWNSIPWLLSVSLFVFKSNSSSKFHQYFFDSVWKIHLNEYNKQAYNFTERQLTCNKTMKMI